jgi:hypothetical protein
MFYIQPLIGKAETVKKPLKKLEEALMLRRLLRGSLTNDDSVHRITL